MKQTEVAPGLHVVKYSPAERRLRYTVTMESLRDVLPKIPDQADEGVAAGSARHAAPEPEQRTSRRTRMHKQITS